MFLLSDKSIVFKTSLSRTSLVFEINFSKCIISGKLYWWQITEPFTSHFELSISPKVGGRLKTASLSIFAAASVSYRTVKYKLEYCGRKNLFFCWCTLNRISLAPVVGTEFCGLKSVWIILSKDLSLCMISLKLVKRPFLPIVKLSLAFNIFKFIRDYIKVYIKIT